jgi:four helix bundle protein
MGGRNYRDLIAWQKAMDLVETIYQMTRAFPREEIYSLTSQIRRAAVSIPSNISEGQGRGTDKEFLQFLRIAHGSLREVETQVLIAERLAYIEQKQSQEALSQAAEVGRLLTGLMKTVTERTP